MRKDVAVDALIRMRENGDTYLCSFSLGLKIKGNGVFYEQNDVADLSRILRSLNAVDMRRTMGQCGKRKILGKYSWKHKLPMNTLMAIVFPQSIGI